MCYFKQTWTTAGNTSSPAGRPELKGSNSGVKSVYYSAQVATTIFITPPGIWQAFLPRTFTLCTWTLWKGRQARLMAFLQCLKDCRRSLGHWRQFKQGHTMCTK